MWGHHHYGIVAVSRLDGKTRAGNDEDNRLAGSWRITISSPADCQGAPPACTTALEFNNFYPGGTLTETNTLVFATSEPNPPNFAGGSDGYGVWEKTEQPGVYSILFRKFLFQTVTVPTSVSPTGKLVENTGIATFKGKYTVNEKHNDRLTGAFTIVITPPNSSTVIFQAAGSVAGERVEN